MSAIAQASRTRREQTLAPNYIVLALLLVFASGPLLVLAFNSLKTQAELGRNPLGPPQSFMWENFPKAWDMGNFAVTTRNSGILVVGTVIGVLLLGGMAAYSLAKLDLPGSGPLTLYLLIGTSLPIQLYLVPLYFTWNRLGLVNNLFGLIVIYIATNGPIAVFLLRSYMPGFLTVGLVVALSVWNEFLLATVFLTEQELFTVVTSYNNFAQRFSRDWTMTSAAAIMMILPVIIIFLSLQRRFIEGLTQGGIKG